ncbi:MAG: hypothetical protein J2P21_11800 [Chloracidobacterium sp.]|nr:hypothetical protein [Chloracidobacterium sp.]
MVALNHTSEVAFKKQVFYDFNIVSDSAAPVDSLYQKTSVFFAFQSAEDDLLYREPTMLSAEFNLPPASLASMRRDTIFANLTIGAPGGDASREAVEACD